MPDRPTPDTLVELCGTSGSPNACLLVQTDSENRYENVDIFVINTDSSTTRSITMTLYDGKGSSAPLLIAKDIAPEEAWHLPFLVHLDYSTADAKIEIYQDTGDTDVAVVFSYYIVPRA